ncbi:hypothetical protein TorRG33x02_328170 [Trema orientale]|uniref:Uncharacterized protein n=1 Tax=Trema orientale TaxID=63057 RepID=A0A2P5BA62_TREOI|nr:hypothetical protein TorRG33x02_328170 [Trema orientale]
MASSKLWLLLGIVSPRLTTQKGEMNWVLKLLRKLFNYVKS